MFVTSISTRANTAETRFTKELENVVDQIKRLHKHLRFGDRNCTPKAHNFNSLFLKHENYPMSPLVANKIYKLFCALC